MSDPGNDDIEALKSIVRMLFKQLREITAEGHAIRTMLERRGLYDEAEFEKTHSESLAEFDRLTDQFLNELVSKWNAEAARRLLESYEGKPQ